MIILSFLTFAEKVAEPAVVGESGMNAEEKYRNMMSTFKLSDSPILSTKILKLIEEVKSLNSSKSVEHQNFI